MRCLVLYTIKCIIKLKIIIHIKKITCRLEKKHESFSIHKFNNNTNNCEYTSVLFKTCN